MIQTAKKRFTFIIAALLIAALALFAFAAQVRTARADDEDTEPELSCNWTETVTIANKDFGSASGTPAQPSDWTAFGTNSVTAGIYDTASTSDRKTFELDKYDAYKASGLETPFRKGSNQPDDNGKFLLINAGAQIQAYYGYSSQDITLSPSSYYKFSVNVATSDTDGNGGANVILAIGDDEYGFEDITDRYDATKDDYGWQEYTLYVATPAFGSLTAKLNLSLGRGDGATTGFAAFDCVTATRLSAHLFAEQTATLTNGEPSGQNYMIDLGADEFFTYPGVDGTMNGSLGDFGTQHTYSTAKVGQYDLRGGMDVTDNSYGIDKRVYAPFGSVDAENKAAVLSTYDAADKEFDEDDVSLESNEFTIERYTNYRISVWYYAFEATAGDGVNIKFNYKPTPYPETEDKEESATGLAMDDENPGHMGWNEFTMLVKGSAIYDYTATLTLGLGTEDNPTSGAVLFDEVRFERLTTAEFNSITGADLSVTIDSVADNSGVTNGNFNAVTDIEYAEDGTLLSPLTPESWTFVTAGTTEEENIKHGLVPIDEVPDMPKRYGNALMLSASGDAAFGYRSAAMTIPAVADDSGYKKLTIALATEGIDLEKGCGVNLILKAGDNIIGSIERISKSNDYSFYIAGGTSEKTVTLELWLGRSSRGKVEYAGGTAYVSSVTLTDSTAEEFADKAADYAILRNGDIDNITHAAISLGNEDFTQFDTYSAEKVDGKTLYRPYNWSLTSGDAANTRYGFIADEDEKNRAVLPYVLMLRNSAATYSTLTLNSAYDLEADGYYKLTVSAKTVFGESALGDEKAVGAHVELTSGDYRFTFKDTTEAVDSITNNVYKDFVFYIKAPAEATTTSLEVGLGGGDKPDQAIAGSLYIRNITLESIGSVAYGDATEGVGDNNVIDEYALRADLSVVTEEEPEEDEEPEVTPAPAESGRLDWWLVPSILLAVALVIAIVGAFIRRRIEARPKKKSAVKGTSSYDRSRVAQNGAPAAPPAESDDGTTFASFDEDNAVRPEVKGTKDSTLDHFDEGGAKATKDSTLDGFDESATETDGPIEVTATEVPAGTPIPETPEEATENKAKETTEEATEEKSEEVVEEVPAETPEAATEEKPEEVTEETEEPKKKEKKPYSDDFDD